MYGRSATTLDCTTMSEPDDYQPAKPYSHVYNKNVTWDHGSLADIIANNYSGDTWMYNKNQFAVYFNGRSDMFVQGIKAMLLLYLNGFDSPMNGREVSEYFVTIRNKITCFHDVRIFKTIKYAIYREYWGVR